MTSQKGIEQTIKALSADGKEHLSIRNGQRLLAFGAVGVLLGAACFVDYRSDLAYAVYRPVYLFELSLLGLGSLLSFYVSLRLLRTGSRISSASLLFPIGILVFTACVTALLSLHGLLSGTGAGCGAGTHCSLMMALFFAAVVSVFLLCRFAVKTTAPMIFSAAVSTAAVLAGLCLLRLTCPNDSPAHLLVWHLLPAALLAVGGAVCLRQLWRW